MPIAIGATEDENRLSLRGAKPRSNLGREGEDKEIASPSARNDRKEGLAMTQGRAIFVTMTREGLSLRISG